MLLLACMHICIYMRPNPPHMRIALPMSHAGCPIKNNTFGVCSDTAGVKQRSGSYVSKIEARLTQDGDALGAMRFFFTDGSSPDVVGDADLLTDTENPPPALVIDSPVAELRLWYSKSLDARARVRIGRIYLRLLNDKTLDVGNKKEYLSTNSDYMAIFEDKGASAGLGAIVGIFYSQSKGNPQSSGMPISLNSLGVLIPKAPTESAYTVKLLDLDSQMVKAEATHAAMQVGGGTRLVKQMDGPTD